MTNDAELDALTARLRLRSTQTSVDDRSVCYYAADAITTLRQERDSLRDQKTKLQDVLERETALVIKFGDERDAARADADALRALIRDMDDCMTSDNPLPWPVERIDAALSREGK